MTRRTTWIYSTAAAVMMLAACRGETAESRADSAALAAASLPSRDSVLTAQNAVLQAQKDSLFGATRSLLEAMASIDSATSAAGVKARDKGEPITKYEEGVRQRTVEALKRLRTTQERLNTISAQVDRLGGQNTALKSQVATFRSTVAALQTQLTAQRVRGDSLVRQLYATGRRADSLAYRTQQLGYTIDSTNYENRRVFAVSGTADYLLKHGIVKKVGGTRFPFIVRIGETIAPANTHPDTTLFRAFDMLATTTVPVDSTKTYEVISSQDLAGADHSNLKGRMFNGAIHVTNPRTFWRPSPYLILLIP